MSKTESQNVLYRSLDELEDTQEFQEFLTREFPEGAENAPDGFTRRRWLQLMGASAVLAGVSGCRFENRKITPYSFRPEDRVPGETRTFATTIEWAGSVRPLFITSYDARPIKADGSPLHPLTKSSSENAAKGGSDAITQACVLDLYDPDRSRGCLQKVDRSFEEKSWEDFASHLGDLSLDGDGTGVVFLAEQTTSRSEKSLRADLLKKMPNAKWFDYSPINSDNELAGLKAAFGKSLRPQYSLATAEVVVSLDADLLCDHPDSLKHSRDWAVSREPKEAVDDHRRISRMYAIESQFTLTGVNADHRWPIKSSRIRSFAENLLNKIEAIRSAESVKPLAVEGSVEDQRIAIIANELMFGAAGEGNSGGNVLVVAGSKQPAEVHHLVAVINEKIGSKLVDYIEVPEQASNLKSIADAAAAIAGADAAVIIGGNPVYDAPSDVGFEAALDKAHHKVHLSLARNETTDRCDWHLNQAHPLEAWTDSVAYDGSQCIGQPMIEPLFGGKTTAEFLSILLGESKTGLELTRAAFASLDDSAWNNAVHDGFAGGSAAKAVDAGKAKTYTISDADFWKSEDDQLEIVFTPSKLYDGRLANNGWLQECPDAVTKVTWDNPAVMSPATARQLNAKQNEKVKIEVDGSTVEAPVFIQPGQADNSIGISVGYGRKKVGYIGGSIEKGIDPVGVDVGPIRTSAGWIVGNGKAAGTGSRHRLASTQDHHVIDYTGKYEIGRRYNQLIFEGTYDSYYDFSHEHPEAVGHVHPADDKAEGAKGLDGDEGKKGEDGHGDEKGHDHGHVAWPGYKHLHFENVDPIPRGWEYSDEVKWGMTIDLNKCTGCNSCVVACQAENNIAVVGKDQVARGRELHWMRIDRYLSANQSYADADKILDDPEPRIRTQPVTCHHCENAPCEQVCPVAATVHSNEGLNDMVYNRCIGTRYCGNNCPYKVRRFNYLNYSDATTFIKYPWADKLSQDDLGIRGLANNPEVTIRSRGVMEKCTYCVQRIQNVKIKAKAEGREVGSNEITVACQDVCGTGAIKFGNLADPKSDVAKAAHDVRSYIMLEELNLGQRTKYLAKVTNPNPDWPVFVFDGEGKAATKSYSEVYKDKSSSHGHAEKHDDSEKEHGKEEKKESTATH